MIEFPVRRYCSRDEGWLGSVSRQKIKERLQITPSNLWRHFSPAIWREGYWRHKNIQYLDFNTNPISGDVYVRSNMNHHNIYWLIYRQYHSPCHLLLLLLRAASWTTCDDVDGRKPAGDDHGLHNACYAGGWWWWILDMYDDLWRRHRYYHEGDGTSTHRRRSAQQYYHYQHGSIKWKCRERI